jgi:nucleoside-diphosphate-sugar epimerase
MALTIGIVGANGQVGAETALSLRGQFDVRIVAICRTVLGSAVLRNWGLECRCGRVAAVDEARRLLADCDVVVDMSLPRGHEAQMRSQISANLEAIFRYAPAKAKVIYISSMMAYGMGEHSKRLRSHLFSHSIYGSSKRYGERLARDLGKKFGRDVYSLRLGEVNGRLQSSTRMQVQKLRKMQPKAVSIPCGEAPCVFPQNIAQAIVSIGEGRERPGRYLLIADPVWTWSELFQFIAEQAQVFPEVRIEAAPDDGVRPLRGLSRWGKAVAKRFAERYRNEADSYLLRHWPNAEFQLSMTRAIHSARGQIAALEGQLYHPFVFFPGAIPGDRLKGIRDCRPLLLGAKAEESTSN